MTQLTAKFQALLRHADVWFTGGLLSIILLLILPVPAWALDGLLAASIGTAMLITLVILYIKEPSQFSGFPTLLLIITLFRLALNIASTRLILLDGYAGNIIEAFGNFVVRGNFVVGLVVFLILVLINFVVITKGAGRIAEVAARFTLDAMPGKQMAIDAELNAGLIDERQARDRRQKIQTEADFYGAMDGASKFVRGDAVAGLLITLVNVLGGFAIGIMQKGMTIAEAAERYTLLSIGDGLVSQIPALITSTAAGILVTRAASHSPLHKELGSQLFFSPRVLQILSGGMVCAGLVPGLPFIPFAVLAGASWFLSEVVKNNPELVETTGSGSAGSRAKDKEGKAAPEKKTETMEGLLQVDTLQVELGYGLVSLADKSRGGDLLERVTGIRRNFASEMGMLVPPVRLRDNLQLGPNEYRFMLLGNPVAQGEIRPGFWLAMNATNSNVELKGVPTVEPVFNLPATWIADTERKNAELSGFTVVDATSVLVTHLSETVKRNCDQILTRQDVQNLLDNLKGTHATVVNELVPNLLTVGHIQRILQNLLSEGVSIRNLAGILERVADFAEVTKNPDELSEHARKALTTQITRHYQGEDGLLRAITLDPQLEREIAQGVRHSQNEVTLSIEPTLAQHIVRTLSKLTQPLIAAGATPVLICAPQIRLAFRRLFQTTFADLAVIAYNEVPPRVEVQTAGTVPTPAAQPA